jgi:hypothetical protein
MSRPDEGRISHAQSALEQLYQNFCTNTREAGGLPSMQDPFNWLATNAEMVHSMLLRLIFRGKLHCGGIV